jgi:putative endonuclease
VTPARRQRGARARRQGRAAEWLALAWMVLRGWRIVGFRLRTPQGEIDLAIRRGNILAIVEVKRRATLDDALAALRPEQQHRLRRAAEGLRARHPRWAGLDVRLDLIAIAPGRWPVHVPDAWRAER